MENSNRHSEYIQQILMHFIHAGCTALALALTCVFAGSWLFYFILLLPFLYRLTNTDTAGSAIAGGFFAASLMFVVFPAGLLSRPVIFLLVIISLSAAIVVFSVIINKFRKYFLLNLILSASLCFPLAYLLEAGIGSGPDIYHRINSIGFAYRAALLLGFLLLSLLILAVNSLLLILIDILCKLPFAGRYYRLSKLRIPVNGNKVIAFLRHWECLPSLRAPPYFM